MGFLDALFGRTRPVPSKMEGLFAISTAQITLQVNLQLTPTNRAGVCFKSIGSSPFARMRDDLTALLNVQARQSAARIDASEDTFGFQWLVVSAGAFEETVTAAHLVSSELQSQGYGEQLLAAVFSFCATGRSNTGHSDTGQTEGQMVYWVYNFKRGLFYPFVPRGSASAAGERDNAYEMRLLAVMEHELPMEKELERWYPLWGLPL